MAVRVGFEPTEPVKVQRFSRPPDSTTLAPHHVSNLPASCTYRAVSRRSVANCEPRAKRVRHALSHQAVNSCPDSGIRLQLDGSGLPTRSGPRTKNVRCAPNAL